MITAQTTLAELEALAREYRLISISLERAQNNRTGVAARMERADRVVTVRSGATVADAIALALADIATIPWIEVNTKGRAT